MSKVICDICGTSYQETADSCPICGYTRILGLDELAEDVAEEEIIITRNKGGRFAQAAVRKKNKAIFDFDEVNGDDDEDDEDEDEDEDYEEEEAYEEPSRSNSAVIVILVIVIMLLLAAAGFLFLRFLLPDMLADDPAPVTQITVPTETETEATTEPTVPCRSIALTGGMAELNREGQFYLLNVKVTPEDTTDVLTYTSEDESIATVTVDGRVTAMAEGETTIYITCGKQQINCPVIVKFVEETEPPTEETVDSTEETVEETESTEATEATVTEQELKLKKYDISLTVGYAAQLLLDCDLDPSQVSWTSEHPFIATVDETGLVKAVSYGTTAIIVKYGDQEVQCIVRCK